MRALFGSPADHVRADARLLGESVRCLKSPLLPFTKRAARGYFAAR